MRLRFFLCLLLASLPRERACADDAPPIVITSPDHATTYPFGSIKEHALVWHEREQMLVARIVFSDVDPEATSSPDDTCEFRLPGVKFDAAKKSFYAITARGEVVPVARMGRELFLPVVKTLRNAVVRVQHPHGQVTVVLEAVKPDDPALNAPAAGTNPDGGRTFDLHDLIQ